MGVYNTADSVVRGSRPDEVGHEIIYVHVQGIVMIL